jgi:P27 family predicted phage terminase small subunit
MSRRPTPTALRIIQGNPGKRPMPKHEPKPEVVTDWATPVELAGDDAASAEWDRLAGLLKHARVVTMADKTALIALCQQWSLYIRATDAMRKALIVKDARGNFRVSPAQKIAKDALHAMKGLWVEFGLTPASRAKVSTTDTGEPEDAFTEFERSNGTKR